jgi:hypothetical protein
MDRPVCRIEAVSSAHLSELLRLYIAYRVFYGEAAEEERAIAFIRDRVCNCRDGISWLGTTGLARLALCT